MPWRRATQIQGEEPGLQGDSRGTAGGRRGRNSQEEGASHGRPQWAQQKNCSFFILTMGGGAKKHQIILL